MGRSKLQLPVHGRSVVDHVIDAFHSAGIHNVFVLVREDDRPLRHELASTGARIILAPSATADMRHSVELLLAAIQRDEAPHDDDAWLLSPADHPTLRAEVLRALCAAWREGAGGILVPTCGGRRGHPTLLGWRYAARVGGIPPNFGLNWLLQRYADDVAEVPVEDPTILWDLDTPADYDRLLATRMFL
jgi:CTP:molybdopterin cytidylyltransferase MocA